MFKRRKVVLSAAALTAAVWGWPALARGSGSPLPPLGSTLLLPTVTLLDGRVWSPGKVAGKVLVVYWWASWCPFCTLQSPHMEALWRAQKARGLELLALSIDKEAAAAANYMKVRGYSFPAGMLTQEVASVLSKPDGLPVVVVLKVNKNGRDGQVVFAEAGEMFPEDVEGLKKFL
jgi:thiol-disulfide isomerase/thioredoxin